jgi:hypothetical protein
MGTTEKRLPRSDCDYGFFPACILSCPHSPLTPSRPHIKDSFSGTLAGAPSALRPRAGVARDDPRTGGLRREYRHVLVLTTQWTGCCCSFSRPGRFRSGTGASPLRSGLLHHVGTCACYVRDVNRDHAKHGVLVARSRIYHLRVP